MKSGREEMKERKELMATDCAASTKNESKKEWFRLTSTMAAGTVAAWLASHHMNRRQNRQREKERDIWRASFASQLIHFRSKAVIHWRWEGKKEGENTLSATKQPLLSMSRCSHKHSKHSTFASITGPLWRRGGFCSPHCRRKTATTGEHSGDTNEYVIDAYRILDCTEAVLTWHTAQSRKTHRKCKEESATTAAAATELLPTEHIVAEHTHNCTISSSSSLTLFSADQTII